MLTAEEEKLLALLANIIVEASIKQIHEKRNPLPQIQQHRPEQRQY